MSTATDSILDVSRNGFSAEEVPYSMKGFIANSNSLHLATSTYPKYYLDNSVTNKGVVVSVKPVPTDSETARVLYVDYTKIDDDFYKKLKKKYNDANILKTFNGEAVIITNNLAKGILIRGIDKKQITSFWYLFRTSTLGFNARCKNR